MLELTDRLGKISDNADFACLSGIPRCPTDVISTRRVEHNLGSDVMARAKSAQSIPAS